MASPGAGNPGPIRGVRAIEISDLQKAIKAVESTAFLVPARFLRRVIRRDRDVYFLGPRGSLATTYVVPGRTLDKLAAPSEVGHSVDGDRWPETVILLERPDPEEASASHAEPLLLDAWRRLFRATVQADLQARLGGDAAAVDARVGRVGRTEFEEARAVLGQDGLLQLPCPDSAAYAAFAAHWLELSVFNPALRRVTFPAVEDVSDVDAVIKADEDVTARLALTRLPGAPEPGASAPAEPHGHEGLNGPSAETPAPGPAGDLAPQDEEPEGGPDPRPFHDKAVAARASAAFARGNVARAAVLWARAADHTAKSGGRGVRERAEAVAAVRRLAERLQVALFFPDTEVDVWAEALAPLLRRAGRGFWSPEARLLYDLQRVCIDHEQETYRLEPLPWAFSLGRKPLRRPLPHLRVVTMSKHLRSAEHRLPKVRMTRDDRARLESLMRPAVKRAETALRDTFRPPIETTLAATWTAPANLPERVAYRKLVEELLDLIVRHGYTSLGDLRDASSRSDLKQPDLSGPREFFRGGRLLAADRELASALDGVHRRGEVYLRWLLRFSTLGFGTRAGRLFTRFVALPFGGAYVALEGLQHLLGWPIEKVTGSHPHLMNTWSLLLVGTVALAAINFARFRDRLHGAARAAGRVLRSVFVDWPSRVLSAPAVRKALTSAAARVVWRYALKPGATAAAVWGLVRAWRQGPGAAEASAAAAYLVSAFLFNTPAGRAAEEAVVEAVVGLWRSLVHEFIPGLFRLVVWTFGRVLEAVEGVLYAVDEWLRFRSGQSRAVLALKAALTPFWFVLAYLARLYINVLVEPQVNPIKHFPVVTVSHKVILPYSLRLTAVFAAPLVPVIGKVAGNFVAAANVLVLPGLFGFLVWELKENWRLFAANRPASIGPVVVGSHGETAVRLLRAGFHSGTLPKSFAKLRRAWRKSSAGPGRGRPEKAALKQREALHHVEESLRRFLDRELVALLESGPPAADGRVALGAVRLATNRVRFALERVHPSDEEGPPTVIDLEERDGVLVAGVSSEGWLAESGHDARLALDDALTGLFKKCGVELVQTPGAEVPAGATDSGPPLTPPVRLAGLALPWPVWVASWESRADGARAGGPLAGGVLPAEAPSLAGRR